jgi:catechol 2,3-dioxygenase-like lactoylglutathione lyase family enzyme
VNVEGITWYGLILEPSQFAATKAFATDVLGLTPTVDTEGWVMFAMPNGGLFDLFLPDAPVVPPYGLNDDGMVFGFRVDDIEVACTEVAAAGCELLGEINYIDEMHYAYRHFRGPDGRVWGLNQRQ